MTTLDSNPNTSSGHRNIYGQDNDIEANLLQNDIYLQPQENNSQSRSPYGQTEIPSDFSNNLNYSIKYNVIILLVSLGKVIASSIVLGTSDFSLDMKQIWIFLMLMHDIVYSLMVVTTIQLIYKVNMVMASSPNNQNEQENNQEANLFNQGDENNLLREGALGNQPDEFGEIRAPQRVIVEGNPAVLGVAREITRKKKIIAKLTNFTDTYYFAIFFLGQMIYFLFDKTETNPAINNIMFTYILLGYLWLLSPVLFVMLACLCFPVLLILFYFFGPKGSQVPATQTVINNLPVIPYGSDIPGNKECAICMVDYTENDKIIQLHCSPLHHFHEDCIKHWLQINGLCPICRQKLEGMEPAPNNQ